MKNNIKKEYTGCNIECFGPNIQIIKGYDNDGWTKEECMKEINIDPIEFSDNE